jgi:glucose-fructose oxidoreductase
MKNHMYTLTTPTSRRSFIKKTSLGMGAATFGLTTASQAKGLFMPQAPKAKMGIALVGLGYYSTDLLAPALQETENIELRGIVTGTPEKEKIWQDKYGIKPENTYNYDNFDEIASNEEIDIIYVVLPNSMHHEYVIRAAKAGKHVICEKPMALNVKECEEMIAACKDNGVQLSIGYRMHFEPTTQEIMRIGQEKVYGEIRFVSAGAGYNESRKGHWKTQKNMGGGAMMDMGVYSLNAARYVTGEEPISVSAQTFTSRPEIFQDVDETTTFQLEFPGGAIANLHTSFHTNMNYLHTSCANGWYKLDPFSAYRGIKGETKDGPLNYPVVNQQATQMDEVADSIANNKPLRVPGEEGLKDMRVVEAIYQSIASGEKVRLDAIN